MTDLFVIIGSPISGLNLLSNCFNILGIKPLDEHSEIKASAINELLLQDLGKGPRSPALPQSWLQSQAASKAKERIGSLLRSQAFDDNQAMPSDRKNISDSSQLAQNAFYVILNNSLITEIWYKAIEESRFQPKYIFLVRHPFEVAMSLEAKHGIDKNKGHILWLAHTRAALRASGLPVFPDNNSQITDNCLVTYDQLLADPISTCNAFIFSSADNREQRIENSLTLLDYVQPTLKTHHAGDLPEVDKETYKPFAKLYNQLRAGQKIFNFDLDHGILDVLLQNFSHQDIQNTSSLINRSQLTNNKHSQITDNRDTDNSLTTSISLPSQNQQGYITKTYPLIEDQWQKITLNVPEPELLRDHPIRFQPLNTNGIVRIAGIRLVNKSTDQNILDLNTKEDFDQCQVQGSVLRLPDEDSLLLMSTGEQPGVDLLVGTDFVDCPCDVVFWVKAKRDQSFHLAEFLNQKGEILYNNEQFKEAAECFQQARDLQAGSAWYCQNLAEAIARVNYNKNQVWHNRNLAKLIDSTGKWDVAVRRYRQALKLDPEIVQKHQSAQTFNVAPTNEKYVESPVFIVGCGHSGTSLLLAMLGNHPSFNPIPKESALFLRTDKVINKTLAEWDHECVNQGKKRWVEKTPPHIFQIHRFLAFRPQSQLILMLRDGRDVVCSLRYRKGYEQIQDRIDRWVYDNMAGLPYWQHPQVKVVKYEDLIATPETVMCELCQFLREDYSSALFEYYKTEHYWFSDRIEKPEAIKTHKDHNDNRNWQINQPIFDGRGRWYKEMPVIEKKQFKNSAAQHLLEQFGYVSNAEW